MELMHPFTNKTVWSLVEAFYKRYYSDHDPRRFIFGINPGRFGGGVTGIPFTDPIRLQEVCGIANDFKKQAELSSVFVYEVIEAYGGATAFYHDFFVTALSPLGFVREGKNVNYYDDALLLSRVEPFMIDCIRTQINTIGAGRIVYCLGEGENFKYFSKLNAKQQFFSDIIPLPHPRWVMQYRRKKIREYIDRYVETLRSAVSP